MELPLKEDEVIRHLSTTWGCSEPVQTTSRDGLQDYLNRKPGDVEISALLDDRVGDPIAQFNRDPQYSRRSTLLESRPKHVHRGMPFAALCSDHEIADASHV